MREDDIAMKPHFISYMFLWSPLLIFMFIFVILSIISAFGVSKLTDGTPAQWFEFVIPAIFGVIFLLWFVWRFIKYKKESYTITDRKIIYKKGNLFSDNSVEIALDRVVQVKSSLGFVQYNIFKTGDLEIKTAGSTNSTVYFKNISTPIGIYEVIKWRMKKNWFHLEMNKLVQEERPHWLGIVWEVFWKALMWILFVAYIIFSAYIESDNSDFSELSELSGELWEASETAIAAGIWFGTVVLAIIIIAFIFKYLDLRKRKYQIFVDAIVYKEWFLTKHHSFLPMENISDTENKQSFFSKIFGLHDVIVSSSWNDNKVSFKNMVNGEKMMENIKYLKDETILTEKDILEWEDENKDSLIGFKNTTEMALNFNKEYQKTFKMNVARSLFPVMLLAIPAALASFFSEGAMAALTWIIPFALVFTVMTFITIKFTDFIVWKSSIEKKYGFLNTKHNSFSVEKITGVVFKESLIDKLFKTCSITFWSIWNGADITFRNIKKITDLEKNIKEKLWIQTTEEIKTIESDLNFGDYIKSAIGGFIFFISIYIILIAIILIVLPKIPEDIIADLPFEWIASYLYMWVSGFFILIAFLYLLRYFYAKFYYSPVRYINKMYSDSLESIQWFFVVHKKYSLFRNVKATKAKKYPLTQTWNLTFDIAWEQIHLNNNQKDRGIVLLIKLLSGKRGWGTTTIVSNTISMKFIKNVFSIFEESEDILNEEPVERNSLADSKQAIWNSIIFYVILAILLVAGINYIPMIDGFPEEFSWVLKTVSVVSIVLFSLIIGLIIWSIKVKFYDYQKDRILFRSGIIYKSLHSILYKKFNYVESSQGFINKVFRNGNIKVYTLGSWGVDMYIQDVDNYKEVNELFKK